MRRGLLQNLDVEPITAKCGAAFALAPQDSSLSSHRWTPGPTNLLWISGREIACLAEQEITLPHFQHARSSVEHVAGGRPAASRHSFSYHGRRPAFRMRML